MNAKQAYAVDMIRLGWAAASVRRGRHSMRGRARPRPNRTARAVLIWLLAMPAVVRAAGVRAADPTAATVAAAWSAHDALLRKQPFRIEWTEKRLERDARWRAPSVKPRAGEGKPPATPPMVALFVPAGADLRRRAHASYVRRPVVLGTDINLRAHEYDDCVAGGQVGDLP